jgi:DNA helicase HerA-like ATPase
MDVPICIDLDRFVERSNGVFGKSGTGKSFLTRLLLSGIIRKQAAVNLILICTLSMAGKPSVRANNQHR